MRQRNTKIALATLIMLVSYLAALAQRSQFDKFLDLPVNSSLAKGRSSSMFQIVITFLILGGGVWSVVAYRFADRRSDRQRPRSRSTFPMFGWLHHLIRAVAVMGALAAVWRPRTQLALFAAAPGDLGAALGCGVALAGLGFSSWGLQHLGPQYSPCYKALQPRLRVSTGPYRLIHHPIYVGNTVALAGLFVIGPSFWSALGLIVAIRFYVKAVQAETRELAELFDGSQGRDCESRGVAP
jgi:protein-S-isoprenylcysteine O-methyltransferase Ste14/uncharacterized membrane protein (DUF485 family)